MRLGIFLFCEIAILIFACEYSLAQINHSQIYLINFDESPTEIIRENRKELFTQGEYIVLVKSGTIGFDAIIVPSEKKIVSLTYSELSKQYNQLAGKEIPDSDLANKVAEILLEKISLKEIRPLSSTSKSDTISRVISIIFDDKDVKKALKEKNWP